MHSQLIKRWLPIILGGLLIFASIGLTIFLAIQTWDRINVHGRAVIINVFPIPTLLYFLLLMTGAILITLTIINWQNNIELFEKGLIQRTARRKKPWIYEDTKRFDIHITQITFGGSMVSIQVRIFFEGADSNRLVIHNRYAQMTELINQLRSLILPKLIDISRQRLQLGEILEFHKTLQAKNGSFSIHGELTPIEEIAFSLENQILKLHKKANPKQVVFKSKIQRIKNLDLLLNLLENPPLSDGYSSPK